MSDIVRFGVSLEKELLDKFDRLIKETKYPNRSEAIRDLIRENLVKREWVEEKKLLDRLLWYLIITGEN